MADLEKHLPYALRQFESEIIVPLEVFGWDATFTTGSLAKVTSVLAIVAYLYIAGRERAIIPRRLQASAEVLYTFVSDTVIKVAGPEGGKSIPFMFSIFVFVLFGTLLGLTPIKETFTSHLSVTFALAMTVFVYVNVIAFRKHGLAFFRMFLPPGVPKFVAPILVLVEVISYLFRPITLGFRIFANIFAGHVMLKLFADICVMLLAAFGSLGALAAVFPVLIMVVLYGFEIVIICIQSYIFMLISCIYLRDALHTHSSPSHS
jgi:F-type H+-transporting ATPase subunit a